MESGRRFLLLLFVAAMPLLCWAQEQYKSVETTDLLKAPQKYWARPIVFKDTLTEPPKDARVEIEGKRYAAFSTRDVGVCYASADLLPAMSDLAVKREYLFSGTVFQNRGRYVPVIQSYTPAMDTQKLSADIRAVAEEAPDSFTNESVRPMADLLAAVQSAQVAYAKEKNIPLCQLYDPTSEHFVKAMDIARTAIYSSEQKNNTASAEILAQYLSTVLSKQCPPGSATQTVTAAESAPEKQEPPEQVEEAPAPSTTNVAPVKLSWSERKAKARAKKTAELKEKQERDAALAAEEAARKEAKKAAAEYEAQQKEMDQTLEMSAEPAEPAKIEIREAPEEAVSAKDAEPKAKKEPDAAQAAEDAARKAAAEYQAQQKEMDQTPDISAESNTPAKIEIQEAPEETAPATNVAPAAESSDRKPASISWFQRWKMERQKRAVIDAELRRIEQEKEEAAQRLAAEKKAEMKEAEEQKRSEEKIAEELKKKQETERLKAESKKAKATAAKKPSAEKTPPPATTPASGDGIYSPVSR